MDCVALRARNDRAMLVRISYQTHPFSLGAQGVAYVGFAGLFDHFWTVAEELNFHANFVARANLVAELYLIQSGKEEKSVCRNNVEVTQSRAACLSHSFAEDNSRNYRVLRKVALKEKLVFCKSMLTNTALLVCADNSVYKKERLAVWQK